MVVTQANGLLVFGVVHHGQTIGLTTCFGLLVGLNPVFTTGHGNHGRTDAADGEFFNGVVVDFACFEHWVAMAASIGTDVAQLPALLNDVGYGVSPLFVGA